MSAFLGFLPRLGLELFNVISPMYGKSSYVTILLGCIAGFFFFVSPLGGFEALTPDVFMVSFCRPASLCVQMLKESLLRLSFGLAFSGLRVVFCLARCVCS